jgi:demethoxyubiquinone hydroxylase (CLK1/Coq7/Cat5 family)
VNITSTNKIQSIIKKCFETQYSNKIENLEEMENHLDSLDQPKFNQEDINHLNTAITSNEIEQ